MDFKQIQELIKVVNKSNIGELSIEEKDFKITIKQKKDAASMYSAGPPPAASLPYSPAPNSAPAFNNLIPASAPPTQDTPTDSKTDSFVTIKSPMIGTFYRSSSPDKPPLTNVGDEISVGKPVCIIEAMKLFNEIESEVAGKIIKVLAEDASPVEYDQPLFLVDPS